MTMASESKKVESILRLRQLLASVRHDNTPREISPGVYIGSIGAAFNKNRLKAIGITHILCLASGKFSVYENEFKYELINVQDSPEEILESHFEHSVEFIEDSVQTGGKCLIHCFAETGRSRSAAIGAAYLIWKYHIAYDAALAHIQRRRYIQPNQGFIKQLSQYHPHVAAWRRSSAMYHERFLNDFELRNIQVAQRPCLKGVGGVDPGQTGCTVWDSSIVLGSYLTQPQETLKGLNSNSNIEEKQEKGELRVLEIGSGTGFAGLCMAKSGRASIVLLSDLEPLQEILMENIAKNKETFIKQNCFVGQSVLSWTEDIPSQLRSALNLSGTMRPEDPFDVILAADVCYRMSDVDCLISTLKALVPKKSKAVALVALSREHCPEAINSFILKAREYWSFDYIPIDELDSQYTSSEVVAFTLYHRKK